jgi:zinc protease
MKRLTLAALAVLCSLAMAQAATSSQRVVLPNGLVVIAIEDHAAATAALHLGVRFDPAGIPAAKAGLAAVSQQLHQAELREQLKAVAWQGLSQELAGTRAVLMLNTEVDYCELRGKVSDEVLPQALQLAGRVQLGSAPVGDEQLQHVRDILKAAQEDAAERLLELTYDRFLRALLGPASPLTRPILGTPETAAAVTAADVAAFRRDYMGPNNAVLTVIAPRPVGDLVDLAKLTMGDCAAAQTRVQFHAPPVMSRSRASVAQQEGWRGVSLMVGVPAPGYGTADFLKTQLVYTLLEGEGGRLGKDEVLRGGVGLNRIATRAEQPFPVTILPPMATPRPFLVMHMVVAPREMEAARALLLKHFDALAQQPPTEAELQRAKERLINSYATLRLARMDYAKNVSCVELYGGDLNLTWQAEDAIAAITAAEVMALAKQFFQYHAVGVLMPGDDQQGQG